MKQPNSVEIFVKDAVGDTYCHSFMSLALRDSAVKHARWWMRQRKHIGFDGKPVPICRPLQLVVLPYYDPSSREG